MRRLTAAVALAAVLTATGGVPAHAYAAGIGKDTSARAADMAAAIVAAQPTRTSLFATMRRSCPVRIA